MVDWSAAIGRRECRFFPLNLLYRRFILDDMNAVIKLQLRHCPDAISDEDRARYYFRSRPEKLIRAIRDRLRGLLQKIA